MLQLLLATVFQKSFWGFGLTDKHFPQKKSILKVSIKTINQALFFLLRFFQTSVNQ